MDSSPLNYPRTIKIFQSRESCYNIKKLEHFLRNHHHYLIQLVQITFYCTGWIAGVITDSCVRKKPALLFSVIYSSAGACSCLLLIYYTSVSKSHSRLNFLLYVYELKPGFPDAYFAILISVAAMAAVCNVLLPTLGGDQIPDREGVRIFYTWFYFLSKIGELVNCAFVWMANDSLPELPDLSWIIIITFLIIVIAMLAILLVVIFSLPQLTRSVNADLSVITDGCGILAQSIRQRRFRPEGSSPLSGAATSNGGDYPDMSVQDRMKMIKFAVTCLLLLPIALAVAPSSYVPYNPNDAGCIENSTNETDKCHRAKFNIRVAIHATRHFTAALGIVLLYILCHVIQVRGRFKRPSLLSRFIAGHVTMMIATITSLFGYYFEVCSDYFKILPCAFAGLTNALIYTTGYELTFISAPRSMQGTAMGMFLLTSGISYSLNLLYQETIVETADVAKVWDGLTGVGGNLIGLLLIVVVHKRYNLGLSQP